MGAHNTGKIMAWVGSALWAAFAVGAPLGTFLYASRGFTAMALATMLFPLGALLLVVPLRGPKALEPGPARVPVRHRAKRRGTRSRARVRRRRFGAVTTFIVLLYAEHGWSPAWLAFTTLSVAFMVGRLVFRDLPDRMWREGRVRQYLDRSRGADIDLAPHRVSRRVARARRPASRPDRKRNQLGRRVPCKYAARALRCRARIELQITRPSRADALPVSS